MTDVEIIKWLRTKGKASGNTLFEYVATRFQELVEKETNE